MPDLLNYLWPIINGGGILAFAAVAVYGFARGWWIPGYIYQREIARSEKLADQVDQNNKAMTVALDRLTDEVRSGLSRSAVVPGH
jgi:ABC-type proline/glycine betaine transport system substrate-binding protein